MPVKSIKKNVTFDGSKFYLEDSEIGEIEQEFKFQEGYDKDFLDQKKCECLGRIINCEGI